ncbi:MAG TPA: dihydrolipoyllysine-residue acetyltransferase [Actinomycetes bacterium]|nr:dihydrolipoyllysine-residue acetyltransferase [Actinomycetes bacterium]
MGRSEGTVATTEIAVPDIGDYQDVPVIEVHVAPGDVVAEEDPLVTLESDKATMDVPATAAGKVQDVRVKVGDTVSEGTVVVVVGGDGAGPLTTPPSLVDQQEPAPEETPGGPAPAPAPAAQEPTEAAAAAPAPAAPAAAIADISGAHASPSVRRLARELGLDLNTINGSGEKGRITKDDLVAAVRGPAAPAAPAAAATGAGIPEIPAQDFSKFGPVETVPLPRIKKLSGPFLHRSWLNVPHVTHNDEADITELDGYRRELDTAAKAEGYRVTLLAFLMKAAVSALRQFPEVNSSLSPEKDSLILKRYHHNGIAVDTPGGLVVPVIRDVGAKGITELSKELGAISQKARDGKLSPADMSGGTFTISSLGGIGGTSFTPIVNSPEVAILGVVRARTSPVWDGEAFQPRLMLPVSLSYDHRVIDGALAARFTRQLCNVLEDVRRLLL